MKKYLIEIQGRIKENEARYHNAVEAMRELVIPIKASDSYEKQCMSLEVVATACDAMRDAYMSFTLGHYRDICAASYSWNPFKRRFMREVVTLIEASNVRILGIIDGVEEGFLLPLQRYVDAYSKQPAETTGAAA